MQHYIFKFVFLNLFVFSFLSPALAQEMILPTGDFKELKETGSAIVADVIDPMTVRLDDGRTIHLTGLDYPDLDHHEPGPLSVTAQHILEDFLKGKKVIIYQTPSAKEGRINRMNHKIAHIVRKNDKVWTQGLIIKLGLARVRTTPYNAQMAQQMLHLEDLARGKKSGLWEMEKYKVLAPDQAQNYIDSYQIIEGKVISASMKKNRLYLNFGRNWKDDFTVSVSSSDLRRFARKGLEPNRWSGKKIRVRGWLESYNGAYMEVDHPARFEALFAENTQKKTPSDKGPSATKPPSKKTLKGTALPAFND